MGGKKILKLEIWPISSLFFEGYYCESGINSWNEKYPWRTWTPALTGTVNLISSDPPCKDGNARFTTVPFKDLSDQAWIRNAYFFYWNYFCLFVSFLLPYLLLIKTIEKFTEIEHFELEKMLLKHQGYGCESHWYGGSLEIMLTVP